MDRSGVDGRKPLFDSDADYLNMVCMRRVVPEIVGDTERRNPRISPIYADLHGLPPLWIQSGTAEMFYDDAARLAKRASAAGVSVEFEPWENMVHVWQFMYAFEPDA